MAILEVEHLEKRFGGTPVLQDVSFSLEQGQTLAILGSSGSGKTTLLRCLNALEQPDAGRIRVAGETPFDGGIRAAKRGGRLPFGLVFQAFHLFPQYTVRENVTLAGRLQAKRRPDYRAVVQADADWLGASLGYVPGGTHLLEKLFSGRWDGQFLVLKKGTRTNREQILI